MNYSWQRQVVLDTVLNSKQHLTAAQVYKQARVPCPHISLGTVYRNLNTLVEIGKIRRVGVPGEADRFDWELPDHQHFYCRNCHSVHNLTLPGVDFAKILESCQGVKAENYNFIVTGLCENCKGND